MTRKTAIGEGKQVLLSHGRHRVPFSHWLGGSYIKASRHEKRFSRDGASEMEAVRAQAPDPRQ